LAFRIRVGDAREAHAKAALGHQVVDAVDEVLFEQVVLVRLPAAALHGEFEAGSLMSEAGVRGLCVVEPDLERWILTVGEPEVAARAEVDVEYDRVARGGGVGENPRLALLLG